MTDENCGYDRYPFQEAARKCGFVTDGYAFPLSVTGKYMHPSVERAWLIWQAARAQQPAPPESVAAVPVAFAITMPSGKISAVEEIYSYLDEAEERLNGCILGCGIAPLYTAPSAPASESLDTVRLDYLAKYAVISKPGQSVREAIDESMKATTPTQRKSRDEFAAAPSVAIPNSWKLVPVEPTTLMGWKYLDAARAEDPTRNYIFSHAGYRAAIAAAPPHPDALPAIAS